jgi:hypothetical protein
MTQVEKIDTFILFSFVLMKLELKTECKTLVYDKITSEMNLIIIIENLEVIGKESSCQKPFTRGCLITCNDEF